MKRIPALILVLILALASLISPAYATDSNVVLEQASNKLKSWSIFLSGKCKGRVDYPHISSHVKGTVNVMLGIDCPGEFTSINAIFYRSPIKTAADVSLGRKSGRNKITMYVAVPCLSNEGLSVHSYFVTATFVATRHIPVIKTFSWPVSC